MKKKLFVAGVVVNAFLAGVLVYSISSSKYSLNEFRWLTEKRVKEQNEIMLSINNELISLKSKIENLQSSPSNTESVIVRVREVGNPAPEEFKVMTKSDILNLLKIKESDAKDIFEEIDHIEIGDEIRYLKKDILKWLELETNHQTYDSSYGNDTLITTNSFTLTDLSEMINIPIKDIEVLIDLYPGCIPYDDSIYMQKDRIQTWLEDKYHNLQFELKTYNLTLTWGDTARYLNISMERVKELMSLSENPLPSYDDMGLLRFNKESIDKWLDSIDKESVGIIISDEMDVLDYIKYQNADPETLIHELTKENSVINYKVVDGRMVFNRFNKKDN